MQTLQLSSTNELSGTNVKSCKLLSACSCLYPDHVCALPVVMSPSLICILFDNVHNSFVQTHFAKNWCSYMCESVVLSKFINRLGLLALMFQVPFPHCYASPPKIPRNACTSRWCMSFFSFFSGFTENQHWRSANKCCSLRIIPNLNYVQGLNWL